MRHDMLQSVQDWPRSTVELGSHSQLGLPEQTRRTLMLKVSIQAGANSVATVEKRVLQRTAAPALTNRGGREENAHQCVYRWKQLLSNKGWLERNGLDFTSSSPLPTQARLLSPLTKARPPR